MKTRYVFAVAMTFLMGIGLGTSVGIAQEAQVDRTELPVKGPWYPPITTLDARDAKAPPVFQVKAPKDAPNVVVILLDDLGFGGTSAFRQRHPDAALRSSSPARVCCTISSTRRRSARRPGRPSRRAATTTRATRRRSPKWQRPSPAQPACSPTTWPASARCCGSTATARPPSASGTRPRSGKSALRAPSPAGRTFRASTSFTASWAARRTNGRRPSITT